jgi:metallo-beta-lactamase class B
VGTKELSAIIIRTSEGLILIDGALPQSSPLIDRSIAALGLDTTDIRLILTSHAHFDHVGGIAALQRASGATVAASPNSAAALRQGRPTPDDPQFTVADNGFPPVEQVRTIEHGETLVVGDVRITAYFTPGHTPGSTSWSWRSCDGDRCADVVYADSLNPVSSDDFRFTRSDSSPSIVGSFRLSIQTVRELPCDILLTPHPGFMGMSTKLQRLAEGDVDAFFDPSACRAYASASDEALSQRIRNELATRAPQD